MGRIAALFGLGAVLASLAPAVASPAANPAPDWTAGLTLVFLEPGADLDVARRSIQEAGGRVGVVVPPHVLLGWVPAETDARLRATGAIRSLHRQPPTTLPPDLDRAGRDAVTAFARILRRQIDLPLVSSDADPFPPDGRDPGVISAEDVLRNLQGVGFDVRSKATQRAALAGNSDYMSGTVSVMLFFVESNGSGADPNLHDWTAASEASVFNGVVAGLAWWSAQASTFGDCWVAFYVRAYYATQDARLGQWREPVTRPSGEMASSILQVMGNFGYASGDAMARVTAFNTWQRTTYATDWAFSSFLAPNPSGPAAFSDGYAAYAFLGGPYSVLLQRSFGWSMNRIFAHESGHIFRACDEYYQEGYGGCTSCGPCYTTGVDNANCESCNPGSVPCMMRLNDFALCAYTPGQVGWWRNPCGPGPLPPPVLASTSPAGLDHGEEADVTLSGFNFTYGMQASFGPGVSVLSLQSTSSTSLLARLRVDVEAAPGLRDVVVWAPDQQADTLAGGFEVRPTPVHYVSGAGSGVFPYKTPATAALDLATVLTACSNGDTIRIASGSQAPFEIRKSLEIQGSWNDAFTVQDFVHAPTIVQGNEEGPALRVNAAGSVGVDRLVLRGGGGLSVAPASTGPLLAGAGVFCYESNLVLRDCILEDNATGTAETPGAGGGGFFWMAQAALERCTVRQNQATRGAGLYFLDCEARLESNLVEENSATASSVPRWGAGIAALGSSLELRDDVVRSNTGAEEGGGVHVEDGTRASFEGVVLQSNGATGPGGGLRARNTPVEMIACRVRDHTVQAAGAGVHATGDSLRLVATLFDGNQATLPGGGVYASDCWLDLENVTLTANAGVYAGGLFSESTRPDSRVRGTIAAQNALGGLVFLTGAMPSLDWNLVWGNGGIEIVGPSPGPNHVSADPRFADPAARDFHLGLHSPAIDRGDAALPDPDGSRNDRGAYGGPSARPAAPSRVANVSAELLGQDVRVSWQSLGPEVASYAVYRDVGASFWPSAANLVAMTAGSEVEFLDPAGSESSWYIVSAVDSAGHAGGYADAVRASVPSDVAVAETPSLRLHPARPNPVRGTTRIAFELSRGGSIRLRIFDAAGRRVRDLTSSWHPAGSGSSTWDGRDGTGAAMSSGVYWVRLEAEGRSLTRRIVLLKSGTP